MGTGRNSRDVFGMGTGRNSREFFGIGTGRGSREFFGMGTGRNSREFVAWVLDQPQRSSELTWRAPWVQDGTLETFVSWVMGTGQNSRKLCQKRLTLTLHCNRRLSSV